MEEILNQVYENYSSFRETTLKGKWIRPNFVYPLIEQLSVNQRWIIEKVGTSHQDNPIYSLKFGAGATKVMMWTQMHGDEATATKAVFDLVNWINQNPNHDLLNKLTILIIPMLNPDGAERFQRENSLGIDLNRDALKKASIEAGILWNTINKFKPTLALNLHDQSDLYSAGVSSNAATLSFLAPPANIEKIDTDESKRAMSIIAGINQSLKNYLTDKIGRYADEFENRAFGDNLQKHIPTILIEAGGLKDDNDRETVRKYYLLSIMSALQLISHKEINYEEYLLIPENKEILFHLLIRNILYREVRVDIGVNYKEHPDFESNRLYKVSEIEQIGDLSKYYAYEEFDGSDYEIVPGMVKRLKDKLTFNKCHDLLSEGICFIKTNIDETKYTNLPINLLKGKDDQNFEINKGRPANFFLVKNNKFKFAVINGFLIDLKTMSWNYNGLIFN